MNGRAVYMLWLRELKREWRERSRIVASLATPILWLFIFGTGLRTGKIPGVENYQVFIFPGIIGMTLLFSSIRSGISIIWDKEFGFMKEILVAPVSRSTIIAGKALGASTNSLVQGLIVLLLGPLIGFWPDPGRVLLALPLMFVISLGLEGIGLLLGIALDSLEGFQMIMSLLNMPMFFLSGAVFPLSSAPAALVTVSYFDPLTYGVDALRQLLVGQGGILPLWADLAFVAIFALVMLGICVAVLNRKKN